MKPANKGPAGAGGDLERLIAELRSKGWEPRRIETLRASWERACHDPMSRGRGGPSLPENAPAQPDETGEPRTPAAGTPEVNPVSWRNKSDLLEFLDRTAPWADPRLG
ncbi:MAG: hypothetical protein ACRDJF_00735 [Actinomycetota bacterium]